MACCRERTARQTAKSCRLSHLRRGTRSVTKRRRTFVLLYPQGNKGKLIFRNNADLGKGVPRRHVSHGACELLFFVFLARLADAQSGFSRVFSPCFDSGHKTSELAPLRGIAG